MNKIIHSKALEHLPSIKDNSVDLIYIDPPFNTGKIQKYTRIKTIQSDSGDRTGFAGKNYTTEIVSSKSYSDSFPDYCSFIKPHLEESFRTLKDNGSFFIHLDYREIHYIKIILDEIFGRENFQNEIIWAYDYGARSKTKWPCKHDNILWYTKDPDNYTFNFDEMDRIPYMAPGLVGKEKAEKGKTPTDVWWMTIVPTNGKERTGYPTQKPLKLIERIIKIHSNPNDLVLDFFAGSGTTGAAAKLSNRNYILIDENLEAINIINSRLESIKNDNFK